MDTSHPSEPQSNVHKFSGYHAEKYDLGGVSLTVRTDESIIPQRPPCLTQRTVGMYLQPLTRELDELPPKPTIDDLSDTVIDKMVKKDKAFWVDKPGANAYTLHEAYYKYAMVTEMVKPRTYVTVPEALIKMIFDEEVRHSEEINVSVHMLALLLVLNENGSQAHQDIFPRAYSYDLDCVKYRRHHACDGLKTSALEIAKPISEHCRDCNGGEIKRRLSDIDKEHSSLNRWRQYPDLNTKLPAEKVKELMDEVGRPFKQEACNWYYKIYPPRKFDGILRKFSK